jgi:hypothetical protein
MTKENALKRCFPFDSLPFRFPMQGLRRILLTALSMILLSDVDSFKRLSKIKSHIQSEVDFLPSYAQKELKMSENICSNIVRGIRFKHRFKFSEFSIPFFY